MELRRRGSTWEVSIDGRILNVDVTASAGRWSMLIATAPTGSPEPSPEGVAPPPDGFGGAGGEARGGTSVHSTRVERPARSYEVAVERRSNGERIVYVDGLAVTLSVADPREHFVRRRGIASADAGPRSVVSPMPGRIVKVLVREGEAVTAQQGLVVVEAMKMENELRAPRAGTVSAVKIAEGMSVERGAILIVVE
jgi:biotin carboxyl carrier protein